MATAGYLLTGLAVVTVIILFLVALRTIPADHAGVVERLGRRLRVVGSGRVILLPILDRVRLVDLRPRRFVTAPRAVATHDATMIAVRAAITIQATDAGVAGYYGETEIERVAHAAINAQLSEITRSEALTGRAELSLRVRDRLAQGISDWGYRLDLVELELAASVADFAPAQSNSVIH